MSAWTANLSLKRTRVRRASCGARRHAPLSLVRWASTIIY
jgi:hypothetical protein